MKHATYIGPPCGWNVTPGMGALVQESPDKPQELLAQFDDFYAMRAGKDLGWGWHPFLKSEFKIEQEISE